MPLPLRRRTLLLALAGALLAPAPAVADEVSGVLQVDVVDRFAEDRSEERVVLRTAGDDLRIPDAGEDLVGLAGHRVVLSGERDGSALEDAALEEDRGATAAATDAEAAPAGDVRDVLVMPVRDAAQAQPTEPAWDQAAIRQLLFEGGDSVDAYYRALSFGRIAVAGEVRPWATATTDGNAETCDHNALAAGARKAAEDAGVDLAAYDHHLYLFPRNAACKWGGLGRLSGAPAWVNGAPYLRVVAHELGHNLGLHHAGSAHCKDAAGAPAALSGTCTASEYGDYFSVMGWSQRHLLSNVHREQLGLYATDQHRDVVADGTLDLATATQDTAGVKVVRIPRPGTDQAFVLELRSTLVPWDGWPSSSTGNVLVRLVGPPTERLFTQLIDTQPATASQADAPLDAGEAFTDPASGATVAVESVAGGVARVRVGFPPTRPSSLRAAGHAGALDLAWAPSSDDTGVARYEVERDGAPIGASEGTGLRDASAPAGTRTYRVTAVDAAGNRAPGESLTVDVPPAPPAPPPPPPPPVAIAPTAQLIAPASRDLVAPTVRLVAPRLGRRPVALPRDRVLRLRVAGAIRVEARYDGRLLRRARAARLDVRLPRAARKGVHRVEIRATDAAGNVRTLRLRLRGGRVSRPAAG